MPEFISSFTTGFEVIISRKLPFVLKGAEVVSVYDGLIHYRYKGNPNDINKVMFFNNSFGVIKFFRGKRITFDWMISDVMALKGQYLKRDGTFRIRFMRGNQFEKINKRLSVVAEAIITKQTKLRIDRLNPSTELWYVIRNEGYGFYGQLLEKRTATEKNLKKGELRPEFAYLMCSCVDFSDKSVVMDPFAGFGAIPARIKKHFSFHKLLINDMDVDKVKHIRHILSGKNSRVCITNDDALNLTSIQNSSVDLIVTDPPWGYFEEMKDIRCFYQDMLKEFRRVLAPDGEMVILSARKEEFLEAVEETDLFSIFETLNTLVNGKKASVYILKTKK